MATDHDTQCTKCQEQGCLQELLAEYFCVNSNFKSNKIKLFLISNVQEIGGVSNKPS